MSKANEARRGTPRLWPLIDLARREGWNVRWTDEDRPRFAKRGFPRIFTCSAKDPRLTRLRPGGRNA